MPSAPAMWMMIGKHIDIYKVLLYNTPVAPFTNMV